MSKQISDNICNFQLILKTQKNRSPRAMGSHTPQPSAELQPPLSVALGFCRCAPCATLESPHGVQGSAPLCCYTCASMCLTLKIRGRSPCGGDKCSYVFNMQTEEVGTTQLKEIL